MIGQAQRQYEEEEWEKIEAANELQRQGHTLQCAAGQVWCKAKCDCKPGDWLANREKEG